MKKILSLLSLCFFSFYHSAYAYTGGGAVLAHAAKNRAFQSDDTFIQITPFIFLFIYIGRMIWKLYKIKKIEEELQKNNIKIFEGTFNIKTKLEQNLESFKENLLKNKKLKEDDIFIFFEKKNDIPHSVRIYYNCSYDFDYFDFCSALTCAGITDNDKSENSCSYSYIIKNKKIIFNISCVNQNDLIFSFSAAAKIQGSVLFSENILKRELLGLPFCPRSKTEEQELLSMFYYIFSDAVKNNKIGEMRLSKKELTESALYNSFCLYTDSLYTSATTETAKILLTKIRNNTIHSEDLSNDDILFIYYIDHFPGNIGGIGGNLVRAFPNEYVDNLYRKILSYFDRSYDKYDNTGALLSIELGGFNDTNAIEFKIKVNDEEIFIFQCTFSSSLSRITSPQTALKICTALFLYLVSFPNLKEKTFANVIKIKDIQRDPAFMEIFNLFSD